MSLANFLNSYLFAWLFFLGIALGSMALTMMHQLTGGGWGVLIRPITTAAMRTLPLLFVLFFPIFLGLPDLFPWARPAQVASDPILQHAHIYLNPTLFLVRFLIYFVIWIGMSWAIVHVRYMGIVNRVCAGGLVVYVVTMSLAGVDWMLSREPHWVSSIFGFIVVVSQALSANCVALIVLWRRADRPAVRAFAKPKYFIDLGNLVLMWVILWAYMNFAQFLITWTGNERPDISYYVQRTYGGWRFLAGIVIFANFLIPMFMLFFRGLKRDIRRLGIFCCVFLFLRVLDHFWDSAPFGQTDPRGGFTISLWSPVMFIVLGVIWLAAFEYYLRQSPDIVLIPEVEQHGEGKPQPA